MLEKLFSHDRFEQSSDLGEMMTRYLEVGRASGVPVIAFETLELHTSPHLLLKWPLSRPSSNLKRSIIPIVSESVDVEFGTAA